MFLFQVKDRHPKMLIIDSVGSHRNPETIRRLRQKACQRNSCGIKM